MCLQGFAETVTPIILTAVKTLPVKVSAAAKEGHIKALTKEIAPSFRVRNYSNFEYRIQNVTSKDMIIGDSPVIFLVRSEKKYRFFIDKNDSIRAVILPLSKERILIGSNESIEFPEMEIKKAIASCSLDYFVGSTRSDENIQLAGKIGTRARMTTDSELHRIAFDALSKYM